LDRLQETTEATQSNVFVILLKHH